ncbi:putative proline rich signal peptide protein [hydrocarbon metagenome]|uniref:Putative proline rich signal peptide protein n=1 Tax=hydrocarbon metagenome TaxID=938273 RepID=A0A0W8FST8_9ZZZZ
MKKIKNTKLLLIFLFFVFGFIALPMRAQAIEPKIADILITNNRESVLLYARLVNGFKPEMEMAILAGIPAVFTLELAVYQERSVVWDKKITGHEIKRTMKYDNLKKTFSVYTNGNSQPVVFSDLESAQKAMADFNGIVAVPLSSLTKGKNYYMLFKIKMDKVRLPLHMEYVFLFVSYWDFETAWNRQNFSY